MSAAGENYRGLVSVITASCNSAATIEICVRSVQAQTCGPLEHIVVDDGSTDQTNEILSELSREISNLSVIRQPNRGAGSARNAGIEAARGRYIAFLDSDDVWLERKLENQVSFMENQGCRFTYGDYDVADSQTGNNIGRFVPPDIVDYDSLLTRCPIGCSTAAYNQEYFGKRYMPAMRRGQDWALWLALTRSGEKARKYAGSDVIYVKRKGSLSGRKLAKAVDMYRIYTIEEKIGHFGSAYLLLRHTANVLARKI